ncbi:MAG: serine proteinase inhibitor [Terrestrivirus sp.]|uniref:Serine proteinase inhibitor n=1 Tax=Terrestrivirus sp. TaxID=2487775 RepID=A0A3G4ZKV3_9VIRU|nr:MAG: serine proteinase inhibitor [Terrestrivirus sp.]
MSYLYNSLFGKKTGVPVVNDQFQQKQFINKQQESSSELNVVNNNLQEKMMLTANPNAESDPVVFSSFSLISALSMLLIGLTDETLNEIMSNLSISDKHKLFTKIVEITDVLNQSGFVKTSNVIMTKKEIPVMETYLQEAKKLGEHFYFNQDEISALVNKVNDIVSQNTNGLIKKILSESDVNEKTFLVLLNTIYFKSEWATKFDKYWTRPKPFYGLRKHAPAIVSMMRHSEKYFRYFENNEYQAISLPYQNNDISMVVVLNNDKNEVPPIFNHEKMSDLLGSMQGCCVNVEIPKFEQETELDLVPFFKQNGVKQLFKYMHADDMIPRFDEQAVSVIKQKCKIIVHEDGTEAAAATAIVGFCLQSARLPPKKIYDFVADHPFSYHIVHKSGLILFSGVYQ